MRLEWLEDILAVAETGSLSEAAVRRRLTQSAFSRRIRAIEEALGVELFDRSRKPVQLRPATLDRREEMARLAAALRLLVQDLKRGERSSANRIVLASQHALTAGHTPALIRGIQASHPHIYVRLRSANLDECFGQLLARQADIALVYRLPGEEHPIEADYIETLVLGTDRLIPVAREQPGPGNALPYIAYPSEVFLGQVMDRAILPRLSGGAGTVARAETALTLAALELAAAGLGVAWVPASLARARIGTESLADLSAGLPSCEMHVTAVRLAGGTGATEAAVWRQLSAGV